MTSKLPFLGFFLGEPCRFYGILLEIACVFQCTAVVAEDKYKTRRCCLLYSEVVMVTQTGSGNYTLYYKPGTKVAPWKPDVPTTSTTTGLPRHGDS